MQDNFPEHVVQPDVAVALEGADVLEDCWLVEVVPVLEECWFLGGPRKKGK